MEGAKRLQIIALRVLAASMHALPAGIAAAKSMIVPWKER